MEFGGAVPYPRLGGTAHITCFTGFCSMGGSIGAGTVHGAFFRGDPHDPERGIGSGRGDIFAVGFQRAKVFHPPGKGTVAGSKGAGPLPAGQQLPVPSPGVSTFGTGPGRHLPPDEEREDGGTDRGAGGFRKTTGGGGAMIRGEAGFTLAETVTALMVFGVLVSVALPILGELQIRHQSHVHRMEALILLQSEMERVQSSTVPVPATGEKNKKGKGVNYRIRWEKKYAEPHLTGTYVEVTWKDGNQKRQRESLKGLSFRR